MKIKRIFFLNLRISIVVAIYFCIGIFSFLSPGVINVKQQTITFNQTNSPSSVDQNHLNSQYIICYEMQEKIELISDHLAKIGKRNFDSGFYNFQFLINRIAKQSDLIIANNISFLNGMEIIPLFVLNKSWKGFLV